MPKRKSERLKVLHKLADRYEQLAAQDLGRSQGNLQQQQQRLTELQQFREEYKQQFKQTGMNGMDGSSLQAFQNFLAQLDMIIEQQKQTIAMAEQDCSSKKQQWQDKHKTTRIYDKTIERFQQQEQKQQNRAEQAASDERAQHIRDTEASD